MKPLSAYYGALDVIWIRKFAWRPIELIDGSKLWLKPYYQRYLVMEARDCARDRTDQSPIHGYITHKGIKYSIMVLDDFHISEEEYVEMKVLGNL